MSRYERYPKYKDSGVEWLGQVPEHWEVMQFKRIASICNGHDYKDVEDSNGAYPVIGSGGEFARASSYIFDGESVLLGRKGTIDKPLYINGPFWAVDTMFYTKIADHAFPKFVYYNALTIPFALYSTNTALPSMTNEDLSAHVIAVPEFTEQQTIAEALDSETARIDALIAKKTRFIELLQEKRAALINHAVTKGLDPEVKMKDSGVEWIGEVPAHWSVVPIKYVATVGNGSTPNKDKDRYWGNGTFPWLTSGCVNHDEVWHAEQYVTEAALRECHLPIITPPAVLVGITGQGKTRGMASTLKIEATINQHIAYLKPMPKSLHVEFLRRFLDASYEWLRFDSKGVGSTKGAITCEQLSNTKISVPPRAEQEAIVDWIRRRTERFNQLHLQTQRSIDLLKERRSALITAAVTGQIDVRRSV